MLGIGGTEAEIGGGAEPGVATDDVTGPAADPHPSASTNSGKHDAAARNRTTLFTIEVLT